ncbi:MAG: Gfo/Idh/MocA family oxidoreductase [Clostridiales bacterium]|nr:Gfo/Idh/MocA family oxidoreductase [Clostridiales bacterium]
MNKKLNFAVIGCSNMAKTHMNGIIANEGAELYAICDIDEDILKNRHEEFPSAKAFTDYRELVKDENVDAVVLVTPDQLHLEMTEAFLRAGKDVLCEKPMALTLNECEEMMRIEKETGKMLMIGQICRCTPGFVLAKKLIDEGRIGELFFIESEYAHNYINARGVKDWRVTPERHGIIGGGCHAVDLLRWIAGDPTEVFAYSNHKNLPDWPTQDSTVALYKFPNNVMGKVFASIGCRRNYTMRSVFYGTKGTIICDNKSPEIQLFQSDDENGNETDFTSPVMLPVELNDHNAQAEIAAFVDALVYGKELPATSLEGASTVAVCCATVESAEKGELIKIRYPKI